MDAPFPDGFLDHVEAFLKEDHLRAGGMDLYPEVFFNPLMFPLQRQAEMRKMIQLARTVNPKTIIEIGSDKSGGLYHWCKCFSNVKNVIACEIRGTPYSQAFEEAFPTTNFLWVPGSSYNQRNSAVVLAFLQEVGAKLDILFIDGDKGALEADFYTYLPMMSPKGIIFIHDITDQVPGTTYQLIRTRGYRSQEIIDRSDTEKSMALLAATGSPPKNPHEGWLRQWNGASCGVGCIFMADYDKNR